MWSGVPNRLMPDKLYKPVVVREVISALLVCPARYNKY